jgi:hypothetical protein
MTMSSPEDVYANTRSDIFGPKFNDNDPADALIGPVGCVRGVDSDVDF